MLERRRRGSVAARDDVRARIPVWFARRQDGRDSVRGSSATARWSHAAARAHRARDRRHPDRVRRARRVQPRERARSGRARVRARDPGGGDRARPRELHVDGGRQPGPRQRDRGARRHHGRARLRAQPGGRARRDRRSRTRSPRRPREVHVTIGMLGDRLDAELDEIAHEIASGDAARVVVRELGPRAAARPRAGRRHRSCSPPRCAAPACRRSRARPTRSPPSKMLLAARTRRRSRPRGSTHLDPAVDALLAARS